MQHAVEKLALLRGSCAALIGDDADASEQREPMTQGRLDADTLLGLIALRQIERSLTEAGLDVNACMRRVRTWSRDREEKRTNRQLADSIERQQEWP
jgi:hypothetical protein